MAKIPLHAPPPPPEGSPPPSFEERLDALQEVVEALEGETLSLEDALKRYQEGVEHLRACRRILDGAEARLTELVATAGNGDLEERPLDPGSLDAAAEDSSAS